MGHTCVVEDQCSPFSIWKKDIPTILIKIRVPKQMNLSFLICMIAKYAIVIIHVESFSFKQSSSINFVVNN